MSAPSARLKRVAATLQPLIEAARSRMVEEVTPAELLFLVDWHTYHQEHGPDAVLARYPEQQYPDYYRWAQSYMAGTGRPCAEPFIGETEETRQRLTALATTHEAWRKKLEDRL